MTEEMSGRGPVGGDTEADGRLAEAVERLAETEERLAEAEEKVRENWELFLRARADLENYRRRVERDLSATVRRGKADLLSRLLEVADAFDRAALWEERGGTAQSGPGRDEAAAEGLGRIRRLFMRVLSDEGVLPIECLGQPFDPGLHEALAVDDETTAEPDTITAELQKGYTYGDDVLRPARVRVARPPEDRAGPAEV
jgi:molecular chaperone GrpE